MRIAISGSHSLGKSTFVRDFLQAHPDYAFEDEPYRALCHLHEIKFAEEQTQHHIMLQFEHCIGRVEQYQPGDKVICDRSPADFIPYTDYSVHYGTADIDEAFLQSLYPRIRQALQHLDLIIFIPISTEHPIDLEDDGHRPTDNRYREWVDARFKAMYHEQLKSFMPKKNPPCVIEIVGDRRARLAQLEKIIEALINKQELPIWLQAGPASPYYRRHLEQPTLRTAWVEMIRARWGNPENPELSLFPEVQRQELIIPKTIDSEVKVTQFIPPDASDDMFVYLHGGGWVIPTSGKHLAWAKRIAAMSKMSVLSVDYRLIPEHPFPAALHDALTVYQYARHQTSGRVIIGGDSAGANLGAAVALYCADEAWQMPDKILFLCGYADQIFEPYASMQTLGIGSPYVELSVCAFIRAMYLPNSDDWKKPYASPIYGDLTNFPPTCIVVGMEDPLCDDNLAFANKLKAAGVEVALHLADRMPHSFFTYPELLGESAEVTNRFIVNFMKSN